MTIAIKFCLTVTSLVTGVFGLNYYGQKIIDASDRVHHSAYYYSRWYVLPPKIRRMIHIIMVRSTNQTAITLGKMGVLSLETAGKVIISQLTYVTLIS